MTVKDDMIPTWMGDSQRREAARDCRRSAQQWRDLVAIRAGAGDSESSIAFAIMKAEALEKSADKYMEGLEQ